MASFQLAWNDTSKAEGGYVNNSNDSGMETYRGITIVHNPEWKGWEIVHDAIKYLGLTTTLDAPKEVNKRIDAEIAKNPKIDSMVQSFYKKNYWDVLDLDKEVMQKFANKIFDIAVNMGVTTARRIKEQTEKAMIGFL